MRSLLLLGIASFAVAFGAVGARANGPNASPYDLTVWEENHVSPVTAEDRAFTGYRAEAPTSVVKHHPKRHPLEPTDQPLQ